MFIGLVVMCSMAVESQCFYSSSPRIFTDQITCRDKSTSAALGFKKRFGDVYSYVPFCIRIPKGIPV